MQNLRICRNSHSSENVCRDWYEKCYIMRVHDVTFLSLLLLRTYTSFRWNFNYMHRLLNDTPTNVRYSCKCKPRTFTAYKCTLARLSDSSSKRGRKERRKRGREREREREREEGKSIWDTNHIIFYNNAAFVYNFPRIS